MLYPLSYEGGGPPERSARAYRRRLARRRSPRVPRAPRRSYIRPRLLGSEAYLVYLGLIFNDKGGGYVVSLGSWRRPPAPASIPPSEYPPSVS